ncbi:hypothetical protein [Plantactinospora sp. CA-290183]|uniref:hypothetical protein n=1 Tax=Plantactinospora sp. CA-290183 TaxID=3240006 RepID=UPI003D8E7AD1
MALYKIKRRCCGAEEEVQIYGGDTRGQRRWRAERLAGEPCRACQQIAHQAVNERAATVAAAAGWPPLTGSPRQVSWAETIRADQLAAAHAEISVHTSVPDPVRDEVAAVYAEILLRHTDASWWIDNKDRDALRLAARAATAADRGRLAALSAIAAGRTQNLATEPDLEPEPGQPAALTEGQ